MNTPKVHISAAEIKKVAKLARLHLDESAIPGHVQSLSNILDMIAEISAADTKDIPAMTSPFQDAKLPLRQDIITDTDQRTVLQSLAPRVESCLYIVPKVIE